VLGTAAGALVPGMSANMATDLGTVDLLQCGGLPGIRVFSRLLELQSTHRAQAPVPTYLSW
jgi:hypothetical protein